MARAPELRIVQVRGPFTLANFKCVLGPRSGSNVYRVGSITFDLVVKGVTHHIVWSKPIWIVGPNTDEYSIKSGDGTLFTFDVRGYIKITSEVDECYWASSG